ncbi:hypothetical protein K458DRAFT_42110 [Lentithecium fluviatile CBS 122367]|uniref:Hemerythrin-like domain-containing protein n=1 Tax=Lentithecium fluviatile CBS 122367 TaxID=1168545 RepID=A0A6G1IZS5_9PLEO|nr:hypothetical protein K458DRAFT_42110 [Lentithecium fluviatile CBS 122367]
MSTTQTITIEPEAEFSTMSNRPSNSPKYSWELGPMKLIPTPYHQTGATDDFTAAASEMALVHNCIVRCFNSIYLQAPHIPASEHANFVRYCIAAYESLHAHHHGEEEHFFPDVERLTGEKGIMEVNVEQHKLFETGFVNWGNWLYLIDSKKNTFSASTCVTLMDDFLVPLSTHLSDEIETLVSLQKYSDVLDIKAMMEAEGQKVMGSMSKTTQLPCFFLNHDPSFEGAWHSFPPVPPPLRWFLRSVCSRWHGEWWKFSTVGFDGRARELRFRGEK